MTVEIKYVVVREGEEKMSFANKKDADAYDKMLDLAEVLGDWLQESPLKLEDEQNDALAMWLAEQRDALSAIIKTGKLPESDASEKAAPASRKKASAEAPSADVKPIKAA